MSIFEESHSTIVNGGSFNTTNTTYHTTTPSGINILREAVYPNAFYDSDNRADPPKCHPKTRVAVIDKIIDWATGMIDTNAYILWLYGPAGGGKTAIARKVAELFAGHGLLLASFLFFRSDPQRNTTKPLVANIAYRAASVIPGAREAINTVIEADPLILSYSVEMQFKKLVFEPLRLLLDQGYFSNRQFPRLIVIDGLDECLDKNSQTNLIQLLSSSVARYQLPLKFLIVSRPESHIKSAVAIAAEQSTVSHLELNNDFLPEEDIRRFLTDTFCEIKRCHLFRSGIPSLWPSEQQMDTLICKASGQFIYASLAMRFINSTCDSPMRRLDIVLGLRPPINHDLPFAELDALYTFILSCTKSPDLVLCILGLYDVLINDYIGNVVKFVEFVLGLEDGDACIYLSPLNSLLEVQPEEYNEIYFHHSSFMDFLRSPERSRDYCIDAQKSHFLISQKILQLFARPLGDGPSVCRQAIDKRWFKFMDVVLHLTKSLRIFELEHALEMFSIRTYLDWIDQNRLVPWFSKDEFIEGFLNYLEGKGKSGLYHHHRLCYLEYVMCSIDSTTTREKFCLMSTVSFILQEPFTSLRKGIKLASWTKFCATLFGFNPVDHKWDEDHDYLINPTFCKYLWAYMTPAAQYGHFAETIRFVPEPILSHRLANVAISCLQYLHRWDSNTLPKRDHFLASRATKLKHSPWLWRRRMRVTSMGRRQRIWNLRVSRQDRQGFYSKTIQSEYICQKQRIFYTWTLDLLYHTLRKAMKSDELTRALSKPFIPSLASLLFPRRVKRVKKAAAAYLEKFRPSSLDASSVEAGVRRSMRRLPHSNMITIDEDKPASSRRVFLTGRDATKEDLKRKFDCILDAIYCPSGADPKILVPVSALLDQVDKLGTEIRARQTTS